MIVALPRMHGYYHLMGNLILVSTFKFSDVSLLTLRNNHSCALIQLMPTFSIIGDVWPGPCVFPDYTSSKIRKWWANLVSRFVLNGVDGIWNDMNEPAVFEVCSCYIWYFLNLLFNHKTRHLL